MRCPICGEIIDDNLSVCPICGENIKGQEQTINKKLKNKPNLENYKSDSMKKSASNEPPGWFQIFIVFLILVLVGVGIYFFSDPLGELTRGCTSDGDILNGETYYCKNKPWSKVEKRLTNSKYCEYYIYYKYQNDKEENIARLYWDKGNYNCEIYERGYYFLLDNCVDTFKRKVLYGGVCSKRDFIKNLKEIIKNEYNKSLSVSEIVSLCLQDMNTMMSVMSKEEYIKILLRIADRSSTGIKKYSNNEKLYPFYVFALCNLYTHDDSMRKWEFKKSFNKIIKKAIKICPNDYLMIYAHGIIEQNPNKKIELYNQALQRNPKVANIYYSRSIAKYGLNYNPNDIINDMNKAIELNPNASECYVNRALVKLYKIKDYESALEDVEKCIEMHAGNQFSLPYYAKAIIEKDMGNYNEALEACNKAIELSWDDELVSRITLDDLENKIQIKIKL